MRAGERGCVLGEDATWKALAWDRARSPARRGGIKGGARQGIAQGCQRELVAILGEVADLVARHHDLEYAAIYLPVAKLQGAPLVHSEVGDVQPVAKVVEHDARLAPVSANRPGLP